MPNIKELRLRIGSLKNTRKITSAMKMVSAAKLKRAKDASLMVQPYADSMNEMVNRLILSQGKADHNLFNERENNKSLIILISSEKGLCGGFNNSLFKFYNKEISLLPKDHSICVSGKKAFGFFNKNNIEVKKNYSDLLHKPSLKKCQSFSQHVIKAFLDGNIDSAYVFYNRFVSTMTQTPSIIKLVPFDKESIISSNVFKPMDYIFEPESRVIMEHLLPKFIHLKFYQCILDSIAGEHAARMTAMESATNNANDLISTLTIKMNRVRQAAITTELTEIVSGAESLSN